MAFLEGLTWESQEALGETRAGIPIYTGSAHGLTEWKFKVHNKQRTITSIVDEDTQKQRLANLVSQIIDGLSDDALKIAMDMTEDQLFSENAVNILVKLMDDHMAEFKKDESRELYKAGSRTTGPLTRQAGEPMVSYVARRRRWYARLRLLDDEI